MKNLIEKLYREQNLSDAELAVLLSSNNDAELLAKTADAVRRQHYGNKVYIRGLIEISNYCKNDCLYCGIRRSNALASRYRLSKSDILSCCATGYALGFRTFVMQGGEDGYYTDDILCDIIQEIKLRHPDCAVTLSLGERSYDSYLRLFHAGADRYLLRHETATADHYSMLHPDNMRLGTRTDALAQLREIGYQTGSGFMVGSPYQTDSHIIADLRFLQKLNPHMIGIGPFITHKDTPFSEFPSGSLEKTIRLISILRLMFPKALLPSTTALGTIHPEGRELGLLAGANVVMPNLSPASTRKLYSLYDNKLCTGAETAENLAKLKEKIHSIGYEVVTNRGDSEL